MNFPWGNPTSCLKLPSKDPDIEIVGEIQKEIYYPDLSPHTLLIQQIAEEQWKEINEQKIQEQMDKDLAEALQNVEKTEQEQEEETQNQTNKLALTNYTKNTMKALEIAKIYSENNTEIPNIHELFVHYDKCYFDGKLNYVTVKWSYHMKV